MRALRPLTTLAAVLACAGLGAVGTRFHSGGPSVPAGCHLRGPLPDRRCTPGVRDSSVTQRDIAQTICARGYARRVRPPVAFTSPLKRRLLRAYGLPPRVRAYELDHLVPLELGGAPRAVANLWPEPRRAPLGSAAKDAEENLLHRDVCAGRVSLAGAQRSMTLDWVSAYERDHRHGR